LNYITTLYSFVNVEHMKIKSIQFEKKAIHFLDNVIFAYTLKFHFCWLLALFTFAFQCHVSTDIYWSLLHYLFIQTTNSLNPYKSMKLKTPIICNYFPMCCSLLLHYCMLLCLSIIPTNDSNKLFASFTNSNSVKMTSSCSNKQVIHFVPKIFFCSNSHRFIYSMNMFFGKKRVL